MTVPRPLNCLLAVAITGVTLAACGGSDPELVGYQIEPTPQVGHLAAADAANNNTTFPIRAQPDQLLAVFLGFTNCPDVCPLALSNMAIALDQLGDERERVDVAMLTVDPSRDTPDVLTAYVHNFIDDAHALRVEDTSDLQALVDAFGATYDTEHDHAGQTTDVGHTDHKYLVDDTGAVIVTWTGDMTIDDMVNDLRITLDDL